MEHGTGVLSTGVGSGRETEAFTTAPVAAPRRTERPPARTLARGTSELWAHNDGDALDPVIAERRLVIAEPEMQQLYRRLERLAHSELPLLLTGETGTGKTTAAHAVHAWSTRAAAPLLTVDCAAQPEAMVERELFGCERGAVATASSRKPGMLERAHGGTLVLEQVHELSPAMQARLLHVLDHRRVLRIGGKHERSVDVRIIATTGEELARAVAAGRFRRDLAERLSAATVAVPPLRGRRSEIAPLAEQFLAAARQRDEAAPVQISAAALAQLDEHAWPGNIRELAHAMAYATALVDGDTIEPWHLPEAITARPVPLTIHDSDGQNENRSEAATDGQPTAAAPAPAVDPRPAASFRPIAEELQALERRRMIEALHATGGVQRRAAELIGMPVRTFTFKLTQYGLRDGAVPMPSAVPTSRIARRRSRAS